MKNQWKNSVNDYLFLNFVCILNCMPCNSVLKKWILLLLLWMRDRYSLIHVRIVSKKINWQQRTDIKWTIDKVNCLNCCYTLLSFYSFRNEKEKKIFLYKYRIHACIRHRHPTHKKSDDNNNNSTTKLCLGILKSHVYAQVKPIAKFVCIFRMFHSVWIWKNFFVRLVVVSGIVYIYSKLRQKQFFFVCGNWNRWFYFP